MIKITEAKKQIGVSSKEEFLELIYKYTWKKYSLKTTKISDKVWEEFLNKFEASKKEDSHKVYKKNEIISEEEEFLASLWIELLQESKKVDEKEKIITKDTKKTDTKKTISEKTIIKKSYDRKKKTFDKEKWVSKWWKLIKKDKKNEKKKTKHKMDLKEKKEISKKPITSEKKVIKKDIVEKKPKEKKVSDTLKKKEEVTLPEAITVKEFSEKIGIPVTDIIKKLIENKIIAWITTSIDFDTAALIAEEFGVKVRKEEKGLDIKDIIEGNLQKILEEDRNAENLEERPPIVTIMWHVDHGKTKLLDYIRKTNIVEREAWWITQSIWASQIEFNWKKITFIDTPGHELFTELRARWAKITDIAVIVVAADEGVKPQTIEAVDHAKDAGVPIIVAITKIDKPNANVEKVKWQLAEIWLIPSDWGWDIEVVPVSAVTWEWVDELLETILLQAEILELKYNPNRPWVWVILESKKDVKKWVVASVILMTGTLKVGDPILVFDTFGKVRRLISWRWEDLNEIKWWDPAQILWIQDLPQPWRILEVVWSEKEARQKAEKLKEELANYQKKSVVSDILEKLQKWDKVTLKLVLKADTFGSLEALKWAVNKIDLPENVDIDIIHADVWPVSDNDVLLADASKAVVIGFNVPLTHSIKKKAENLKVDVKNFNIIYEIIDYLTNLAQWLVKPEEKEVDIWKLEVLWIFYKKGNEMIIWGKVIEWKVVNGAYFRLFRKDKETWEFVQIGWWKIISLKRETENVDEVRQWYECGLKVKTSKKIQLGDVLEFYVIE